MPLIARIGALSALRVFKFYRLGLNEIDLQRNWGWILSLWLEGVALE